MIARATLALILAGPALVLTLAATSTRASADPLIRKAVIQVSAPVAEKLGDVGPASSPHRRLRGNTQQTAARPSRGDLPPAVVAMVDDGLAYDTPRDAQGHPILGHSVQSGGQAGIWQIGVASWYGGSEWQGRRMSDGTRFDDAQFTAAHLSLPLGTLVRVSLVDGARSVIVRITDRPGTHKRIIDLSRAAAAQLGILSRGLAKVELQLL